MKHKLRRLLMIDILKDCSLQPFIRPAAKSTFLVPTPQPTGGGDSIFGKGEQGPGNYWLQKCDAHAFDTFPLILYSLGSPKMMGHGPVPQNLAGRIYPSTPAST